MNMKRKIIAGSIATVFGLTAHGLAMADTGTNNGFVNGVIPQMSYSQDYLYTDMGSAAASNGATAKSHFRQAVALGELYGEVAYNSVGLYDKTYIEANNTIDNYAFGTLSGISQVSQNSGTNSLTQQNVTVQSELWFD